MRSVANFVRPVRIRALGVMMAATAVDDLRTQLRFNESALHTGLYGVFYVIYCGVTVPPPLLHLSQRKLLVAEDCPSLHKSTLPKK